VTQAASTPDPFRGLERLHHWWRRLATSVFPAPGPDEADRATARLLDEFDELLKESRSHRGGEVSARKRAERCAAIYRHADIRSRAAMLNLITRDFAPDRGALERAIANLQGARDEVELSRAEARLRMALDAPRAKYLAQLSLLPEGVKFLLDLRADLLALLPQEPALEVLRVELDGLLGSWFDPGFLELRRITWDSPALVLEKLIAYEAVHPIEPWNDLRNRLDKDRRCYAFFHPRLSNEPLIFVEVALLKGLPETVQRLLDQSAPALDAGGADTAVFTRSPTPTRGCAASVSGTCC